MMLETDGGVFRPLGFGFSGSDAARATVKDIASLLTIVGATKVNPSGGGADIGPSVQAGKRPVDVARRGRRRSTSPSTTRWPTRSTRFHQRIWRAAWPRSR